ncbi:MAG TPA: winged helix-turn-helix domain-containing protein [Flavobacterium sp.]|jgi:DNA-binding winged helix-turn-helix (wHTH) protein
MEATNLIITKRFSAEPSQNIIIDGQSGKRIKIEPRIMTLLNMLHSSGGKLVTREEIIRTIWNDYGGADEGLNQAISFLRKSLADTDKSLIETVPKKGYILHTAYEPARQSSYGFGRAIPLRYIIGTIVAIAIVGFGFSFFADRHERTTEVGYSEIESAPPADDPYYTTINTKDNAGTRFKLIMIGDHRPQLFINDKLATENEMERHSELISKLQRELWKRKEEKTYPK